MSERLLIEHLSVGPLQVNCYLVACAETRLAMVVDPGDESDRILGKADQAGFRLVKVVNTHGHFDHIGANRAVVEATGAELLIHRDDQPLLAQAESHAASFGLPAVSSPQPDRLLTGGESITIGNLQFDVLHIPGHSPGGICLYSDGHLFAGDVLFAGSIGRTDLPGGNHDALVEGIREQLLALPGETIVHTGHGPETTIAREKQSNPFVGSGAW